MSKFVVSLNESESDKAASSETANLSQPKKRGRFKKILGVLALSVGALLIVGAIGGYFYWQNLKRSPQYSLALLVDAARRDDRKAVDELIDTDAMVDDFLPQITDKAVELYGRNLPPAIIAKARQVAAPLLPSLKIRARAGIPALIQEKTRQFGIIPFWAIALGAGRYVDIKQDGDRAVVAGKMQEQSGLNLTMKRSGERWQVIGVKDEELAKTIAEKIGQQLIQAAGKGGINRAGEELGVGNLGELIKQLDGVFK